MSWDDGAVTIKWVTKKKKRNQPSFLEPRRYGISREKGITEKKVKGDSDKCVKREVVTGGGKRSGSGTKKRGQCLKQGKKKKKKRTY